MLRHSNTQRRELVHAHLATKKMQSRELAHAHVATQMQITSLLTRWAAALSSRGGLEGIPCVSLPRSLSVCAPSIRSLTLLSSASP
jgi:hypothetical protein